MLSHFLEMQENMLTEVRWACAVWISAGGYCVSELNPKCLCGTGQRLEGLNRSPAFQQGAILLFHEPQVFFAGPDIHDVQT